MENQRLVIGIDPGLRGAICVLSCTSFRGVTGVRLGKLPLKKVLKKKTNELDVHELTKILSQFDRSARVLVEELIPMPKQGVIGTQTAAKNFGRLITCLELLSFNYELVRPQIWQSAVAKLTSLPKGEGLNSKLQARLWVKRVPAHLMVDELRHPTPHDGLVDAFLIAYSGV